MSLKSSKSKLSAKKLELVQNHHVDEITKIFNDVKLQQID